MRIVLVAAAFAAMPFAPHPALAREAVAPWCAVISTGFHNTYWDCRYNSIEECRPNVIAGNRGTCTPNPHSAATEPVKRHHKRHVTRD